jgi:2-polyprenyl-3-methyl-5-hydroxy-6-metoxy-1,4-benzoquinol methylase
MNRLPFDCPVCQRPMDAIPVTVETSKRGTVSIQRCTGCGLHVTYPRLDDPQGEYKAMTAERWQAKYGDIDRGERLHDRDQNYREETALLRQYVPAGRVLDVGCNAGWLLGYLKNAGGWQVEGVEPSAVLAEIARGRLNVPIHTGYLADLKEDAAYDALLATDVIEHIAPEDAPAFIDDIRRLLRPGGYFFAKTPNATFTAAKSRLVRTMPGTVRRRVVRAEDVWNAKEHTIHWDAPNLARAFRERGFDIERVMVPLPVETYGTPLPGRLARRGIYATTRLLGEARAFGIAQDILLIARRQL